MLNVNRAYEQGLVSLVAINLKDSLTQHKHTHTNPPMKVWHTFKTNGERIYADSKWNLGEGLAKLHHVLRIP